MLHKFYGMFFLTDNIYCLLCLNRIIEENNRKAPLTYNRMQAIVKTLGPPKKPISAPTMEHMTGTQLPAALDNAGEL